MKKIHIRLLYNRSSNPTIFIPYTWGVGAQGDPCTATISDLLCVPIWFLIIPDSSTRALWQLPVETSSSEAGKLHEEMAAKFCLQSISFILVGFFNMP